MASVERERRSLLLPVDNLGERLFIVEMGILLLRVAGEADDRADNGIGISPLGMLRPQAVAALALDVHEIGGRLLGRKSPRLPEAKHVAREALRGRIALILGKSLECVGV